MPRDADRAARRRAAVLLASTALALAGCAGSGAEAPREGAASAPSSPTASELAPSAFVAGEDVTVTVGETAWRLEVLEAGPVELDRLAMFEGSATAEPVADDERIGWVCVRATQLSGDGGARLADGARIEVWESPDGPRYDDLTGFDYEPADGALDVYEASGNALGVPYERVCPIFVVPATVDFSTIAVVPVGGEPLVIER